MLVTSPGGGGAFSPLMDGGPSGEKFYSKISRHREGSTQKYQTLNDNSMRNIDILFDDGDQLNQENKVLSTVFDLPSAQQYQLLRIS